MPQGCAAAQPPNDQVASVQQLKSDAWKEARAGHFEQSDKLLGQAANLSHDPSVEQMAGWTSAFQSQLQRFAAERHKQYEEMAAQVKLLIKNNKPDYAMDLARTTFVLADNKQQFLKEPWVEELIKGSIQRAEQDEKSEQWLK